MCPNTIFLRLEGALQAWGNNESKFLIRRTHEAPTKSGVIGLLCSALGVDREKADSGEIERLNSLQMGVRIDRPGIRWWDYHTVGAKLKMQIATGKTKEGAMLTRREYLCDASFLVALQGDPALVSALELALKSPKWTPYLGRKNCPPSYPILDNNAPSGDYPDLNKALQSIPWHRRTKRDLPPDYLECLTEWKSSEVSPEAPTDAEVWYDVPITFSVPAHRPRFVLRSVLRVGKSGGVEYNTSTIQNATKAPLRASANYKNTTYRKKRLARLDQDNNLCVFCKSPATTVQHCTYRHAGGDEQQDELRSLCRLCHDAVTMIEYGYGMGMDRINPEDERWRDLILKKRQEIIEFRSLETRRRRLEGKEVE